MTKVNVSVIVPVYNVEQYLEQCLKTLVNQNFDNYEIIVVNDGSPDNSQKIIDEYVYKYPNLIRGYKKKNGGVSSARNYGLEKAKGEYVAFVDSDDYVTDDYISLLYNEAKTHDYDIVVCDMIEKSNTSEKNLNCCINNKDNTIVKDLLVSLPSMTNKMYKKSLFLDNKIQFPNILYGEDLATIGRLLVSAKKVGYINKALYYYIARDGSVMHQSKYNYKMLDIFKSLETLTKYYKENDYYDKHKEEIEYLYISHLLHDYSLRVYRYREGKDDILKVVKLIKLNYPKWKKNKYFKEKSWKYKTVCFLIYYQKIGILKKILK